MSHNTAFRRLRSLMTSVPASTLIATACWMTIAATTASVFDAERAA